MAVDRTHLAHGRGSDESSAPGDAMDDDGVVVAPMKRRHLRAVVAIEQRANPHPWSHSLFAAELSMPTSRFWVIARDGRHVIGFAGFLNTLDEGHITNFAVHEDHRRRHVASRMLLVQFEEAIRRGVNDLTLEVRISNSPAQALYRRFGFTPGGIRAGYYNDNGEDALVMWSHDIGSPSQRARRTNIEESLGVLRRTEGIA
ncbi:MAG: ribosomal protein S18-alanine N-acetyltransferase [Microthrixaceae bacterium]